MSKPSSRLLVSVLCASVVAMPLPAFAVPPPAAPASASASDEVRLVTGGFIKGEIVEYMPGAYVVIVPPSGESRRVLWVDISEIVRDGKLEIWMAAYGPKALKLTGEQADGFILQTADPDIARWTIGSVRAAASAAGRDPGSVKICVAAPAYVGTDLAHQRDQLRWFGGMVGNHVADLVARYGTDGAVPRELTDYIKDRGGYDYAHHGKADNPMVDFVPDEIVDRFCLTGPAGAHADRLAELAGMGVDQFSVYLMHDQEEQTLAAYRAEVIPALR